MTGPRPARTALAQAGASLDRLTEGRREMLRAECARSAETDDAEFGRRLLADSPTHEGRDPALLHRWATTATEFGTGLAEGDRDGETVRDRRRHQEPLVVECTGGIERLLLARYVSRPVPAVELFTDTLALGEQLVEMLGWREWYAPGALRAAALAHEEAHRLLHEDAGLRRALRDRLGHTVLRLGRLRVAGHVVGADELVAHGYAAARCGLGRSPLLLTVALAGAVRALGED
ncbi:MULTISPECIES: hypothetical protein [Actinoalloteichus]|uniref:Uncharacterized protein n=1 Tax=Actinoalloteichus fjordicus TaxID=1612552 RepID=A0AAC9LEK3_9PSEU|nr:MULTISPECIES: hypothetical protein [Actinoalloteichus]APU15420.1 hypothetical protein UA74_16950 [Actinoalloteichus fjordicus]APU21488.1 hypothetical protein UA75_17490 [Actinoalloteichus sp. GBA129-24]